MGDTGTAPQLHLLGHRVPVYPHNPIPNPADGPGGPVLIPPPGVFGDILGWEGNFGGTTAVIWGQNSTGTGWEPLVGSGGSAMPVIGSGMGSPYDALQGTGAKNPAGKCPGDPPTPCLFPPGDLGTSVGTGGKERAGVRLWGRARPRLFAQPKRMVPWACTWMWTRGRKRRILPRKRPNRPRWTSTGCGEGGEGQESAGPQIGEPKSRSPNVGDRKSVV